MQAEAAFRTAKSDLGLRPIYHQLEDRVQAHILVCFLALALWRTLEPATAQLLAHLGLRLPKSPKEIANVVPKTGG